MEQVVAKNQSNWTVGEKISADQERLGQPIGAWLHGVLNAHVPGAAISEQATKGRLIMVGGDDQHFADPGQHQGAERVVNHWFVVHRHQLLAHRRCERSQASTTASCKDDAFARHQIGLTAKVAISAWFSLGTRFSVSSTHGCEPLPRPQALWRRWFQRT